MSRSIQAGVSTERLMLEELMKISKPFERIMVFIDGGYLQKLCEKAFGNYDIDIEKFSQSLIDLYHSMDDNPFQPDLIRIYYYDAIVDGGHIDYRNQRDFFDKIESARWFTVKLGDLVESSKKGFKQKGVDILMAIDALTKAYEAQYDTAIFVIGDRDFLPLVEAVKGAGRKTIIVCHHDNTSIDLMACFDRRIFLDRNEINSWKA